MKKLKITKEQYSKSKYFQNKYGKLAYVSESGKIFKTSKGKVLKFNEADTFDDIVEPTPKITVGELIEKLQGIDEEMGIDIAISYNRYGETYTVLADGHKLFRIDNETCDPRW